jgi:hypothetical protein
MEIFVAQHPDAERIDQRIAEVCAIEADLAADIGQTEAVAVAADASNHARQQTPGIRLAQRPEAQ